MQRIDRLFADLRARGAKGLMPFVTAGDPDLAATEALLPAVERAGAMICELGIPFSDPIADGPVIQASMTHALARGVHPSDILAMVERVRPNVDLGLVAMVSYSIVYRLGTDRFLRDAQAAGIDGLIVPDLGVEEAGDLPARAADRGLTCSMLVAPTTPPERADRIARACTGFVYVLARAGLTGEQTHVAADLPERVRRLREATDLPIAVGFGIATAEHVRQVVAAADAAIVGSAIMRRVSAGREADRTQLVGEIEDFVAELASGLVPAGAGG